MQEKFVNFTKRKKEFTSGQRFHFLFLSNDSSTFSGISGFTLGQLEIRRALFIPKLRGQW